MQVEGQSIRPINGAFGEDRVGPEATTFQAFSGEAESARAGVAAPESGVELNVNRLCRRTIRGSAMVGSQPDKPDPFVPLAVRG